MASIPSTLHFSLFLLLFLVSFSFRQTAIATATASKNSDNSDKSEVSSKVGDGTETENESSLSSLFPFSISNLFERFLNSAEDEEELPRDDDVDVDVVNRPLSRKKRNVYQLGHSLLRSTKYSALKLAHYGYWCGRGGDRHHDGAYIDECDHCCKKHDLCWYRARMKYPGCQPNQIIYEHKFLRKQNSYQCLPHVNSKCAFDACVCDAKFIECMKLEPCPPLKVYNSVSYFWWLGF